MGFGTGAVVAPIAPPSPPAAQVDVASEVSRLESALAAEVPDLIVDRPEAAQEWIARASAMVAASGMTIDRPQLLVVVDRNPQVQQMRLVLAHHAILQWIKPVAAADINRRSLADLHRPLRSGQPGTPHVVSIPWLDSAPSTA